MTAMSELTMGDLMKLTQSNYVETFNSRFKPLHKNDTPFVAMGKSGWRQLLGDDAVDDMIKNGQLVELFR